MRFLARHRAHLYVVAVVSLVFTGVGLLAATSGASSQTQPFQPPTAQPADPTASVGSGPLATRLRVGPYQLDIRWTPNRAELPGVITLKLLKHARPVSGAQVRLTFTMVDMPDMGALTGLLPQTAPATYAHPGPKLMNGRWQLRLNITPPHAAPLTATIIDRIPA